MHEQQVNESELELIKSWAVELLKRVVSDMQVEWFDRAANNITARRKEDLRESREREALNTLAKELFAVPDPSAHQSQSARQRMTRYPSP